jgi:hypothetical protein
MIRFRRDACSNLYYNRVDWLCFPISVWQYSVVFIGPGTAPPFLHQNLPPLPLETRRWGGYPFIWHHVAPEQLTPAYQTPQTSSCGASPSASLYYQMRQLLIFFLLKMLAIARSAMVFARTSKVCFSTYRGVELWNYSCPELRMFQNTIIRHALLIHVFIKRFKVLTAVFQCKHYRCKHTQMLKQDCKTVHCTLCTCVMRSAGRFTNDMLTSIYGCTALVDLGRFFSFLIYAQSVGLLRRGISQSQDCYLHTGQDKQIINRHRQKCIDWDSSLGSQCLSGRRRYMA